MGLFSWIKDKYNEHRYNNAVSLYRESHYDEAIKIFKEILDVHPSAPVSLLDTLHKKLVSQNSNAVIDEIVSLYKSRRELADYCMEFANNLVNRGNYRLCSIYSNRLYCNGLMSIESLFLISVEKCVIGNNSIMTLTQFTSSTTLLQQLSKQLYAIVRQKHSKGELSEALRIANLIHPYVTDSAFINLYYNIKFEVLTNGNISKQELLEYDKLFNEIFSKVSKTGIDTLLNKSFSLCKNRFENGKFLDSLLLSSRLTEYFTEAKTIYIESSLALYSSKASTGAINVNLLYSLLGEGVSFIKSLERFVPYDNHGHKYIDAVCNHLQAQSGIHSELLRIFKKAWTIIPSERYYVVSFKTTNVDFLKEFVNEVLSNVSLYLRSAQNVHTFITELCCLGNKEFVVSTCEKLLQKGIEIHRSYITQVLILIERKNNEEKLLLLNRALTYVKDILIYGKIAEVCEDYMRQGASVYDKVESQSLALVGKHSKAEILLTQLAINRFKVATDKHKKIGYIKKAITYNTQHNDLFSMDLYNKLCPEIAKSANDFAVELYKCGDDDLAINLLYVLRDNNFGWFDTYGQHILDIIKDMSVENAVSQLKQVLVEGKNIQSSVIDRLWQTYIFLYEEALSLLDLDNQITTCKDVLAFINEECQIHTKPEIEKNIQKTLDKAYFNKGINCEKNGDYIYAIEVYSQMDTYRKYNAEVLCRIAICRLKSKKKLLTSDISAINDLLESDLHQVYQKDLAYRWCLLLIKQGRYNEASIINSRILHSDKQIEELCSNVKLDEQNALLSKFNGLLRKINLSELSAQDSIKLGRNLTKLLSEFSLVSNISTTDIAKMKDAIKNYAILQFYKQGEFVKCQEGLKVQDSDYLSNPLNLRNIAIMCLCAAEEGQLTRTNYREFLAIWATAIYQPMLFVQSLDYTSWDDPYTFSLDEVFGTIDEGEELPSNVNFSNNIDSSIVSIREVQKILISRMEAALGDNHEYLLFFNSQLEAMDQLLEQQLDVPCVIVAPYLLQLSTSYNDSVKKSLEIEANGHYANWERILKIGNLYGITGGDFSNYANALEKQEKALDVLNNGGSLYYAFTQKSVDEIRQFTNLFTALVSAVTTKLNNDISENIGYVKIEKTFGKVCKVLADDNLSFAFSNYVNQGVVKDLNNKDLELYKGAEIIFNIYGYCKCNPHLKRNVENIVEALVHNYITDGNIKNLDVLESFLTKTRQFDDIIISALSGDGNQQTKTMLYLLFMANEDRLNELKSRLAGKSVKINKVLNDTISEIASMKINIELSAIIEGVNNGNMRKCDALEKVYDIYKANKDNERVCENLAILIPMCIMEYVVSDKFGKQKVIKVLDNLKYNRSYTFKQNCSAIKDAYNNIWNSLPYDARKALEGTSIGTSLNAQGIALKRGLDYLKELKQ